MKAGGSDSRVKRSAGDSGGGAGKKPKHNTARPLAGGNAQWPPCFQCVRSVASGKSDVDIALKCVPAAGHAIRCYPCAGGSRSCVPCPLWFLPVVESLRNADGAFRQAMPDNSKKKPVTPEEMKSTLRALLRVWDQEEEQKKVSGMVSPVHRANEQLEAVRQIREAQLKM